MKKDNIPPEMFRFPSAPLFSPIKKQQLWMSHPGVQPDAISRNVAMKAVERHWPMALELFVGFPVTAAAWRSRWSPRGILGESLGLDHGSCYGLRYALSWFTSG